MRTFGFKKTRLKSDHGAFHFESKMTTRKVAFFIDGWFMRKRIYHTKAFYYNGDEIRKYCKSHLRGNDYLYRIFYYDTEPLNKKGHNPISQKSIDFSTTSTAKSQYSLLNSIKFTPNFALRLGKTVWRDNNWLLKKDKLKKLLKKEISVDDLEENDLRPQIEQKSVDMKIGIDISQISSKNLVDLLIIITGDADIVPALKMARREGLMVGLDNLKANIQDELSEHVDFIKTKI